jgi:hypothetical protein
MGERQRHRGSQFDGAHVGLAIRRSAAHVRFYLAYEVSPVAPRKRYLNRSRRGGESGTPSPDAPIARKAPTNKDSPKARPRFVTTSVYHRTGRFGCQTRSVAAFRDGTIRRRSTADPEALKPPHLTEPISWTRDQAKTVLASGNPSCTHGTALAQLPFGNAPRDVLRLRRYLTALPSVRAPAQTTSPPTKEAGVR